MPRLTGAQYIARTLNGYGVSHVFFMEELLLKSLVEMERLGIKRILTHCEKSAAYMADGFARVSGRPSLCMAQSVGAANLAAGLQDAYLGSSPVLAFTGRKPPLAQYRNSYQEILHNEMFGPVTKYNVEVDTLAQLPHLLPQAFREATTGTPRPVHLDFLGLEGGLTENEVIEVEPIVEPRYATYPARKPAPEQRDIDAAVAVLREAERPVLVIDRGAMLAGAAGVIQRFAEEHSIPVAFSVDGKGALPDTHSLVVGAVGTYCKPCANAVVGDSDCVIFVGSVANDQVTKNWTLPRQGTRVIQIDISPSECGRNYPGAVGICGDPEIAVQSLADAFHGEKSYTAWAKRAHEQVVEWQRSVAQMRDSNTAPIRPERLGKEITAALPDDAILVADTGYSAIWSATVIDLNSPRQSYIRAAGSLGWAFPAAIGAKCAFPNRAVVCFCGDGALWYHLAELETAKRWGINTVTVVNNNSILGQCLIDINQAYGGERGEKGRLSEFDSTDFAVIANDMGCYGVRVTNPAKIRAEIEKALGQGVPAIVDVVTDPAAHPVLA